MASTSTSRNKFKQEANCRMQSPSTRIFFYCSRALLSINNPLSFHLGNMDLGITDLLWSAAWGFSVFGLLYVLVILGTWYRNIYIYRHLPGPKPGKTGLGHLGDLI